MSDRLDELLTDEEIPKRADVVFYDDYKAMTRNELRVEVRPEVEALRARVRTLERTVAEIERQQEAEWAERENEIIHGTGKSQPLGILSTTTVPLTNAQRRRRYLGERKGPAS